MKKLAEKVNAHSLLKQWIHAEYEEEGVASVRFYSLSTGNVSEGITLEIEHLVPVPILPDDYYDKPDLPNILDYVSLKKYSTLNYPLGTNKTFKVTKTNFNPTYDTEHDANLSFLDSPINAGEGDNPISLTGITERFPLGILLQDSDFLCEDPLNDDVSGMKASPAVIQPIQSLLVPTQNAQNQTYISSTASGAEYTRFTGEAGILLTKAEGTSSPSIYQAWTSDTLLGTKTYRTFRGCSSFVLSGQNPGGPIDWVAGSFPAPLRPVLKGGVLACRALLVRNFIEDNGPQQTLLSAGDEIQMVIMSYGIIGNTDVRKTGLSMHGTVSPSGYGEGYAAVDRYRIGGHPMFRAFTRQVPNASDIQIAPYPETRI
jgi:hypothetical protein